MIELEDVDSMNGIITVYGKSGHAAIQKFH